MNFKKLFTLSYDDGVQQDKRLIEILARYGLRCTFNINSGFFGQVHDLTRVGKAIRHNEIPADEIAAVYKNHEIATHGVTHPDLTQLSRDEIMRQIIDDRQALSTLAGYEVTGHAYPGGTYDHRVAACLRDDCGITYARTVAAHGAFSLPENLHQWHPTCKHDDAGVFDLMDQFIKTEPADCDKLFYLWGHSYEFDYGTDGNTWDHFERLCEKIAGKADICYCTNSAVVKRLKQMRHS